MPAPALFRSTAVSVPDAPQGVVCIDTSALVKRIVREAESDALEHALPDLRELATSAVPDDYAIAALAEIPLEVEVHSAAASLTPVELRKIDAIHVVSALTLADDLTAVLGYDKRMQDAARSRGITVLAPGSN